MVLVVLTTLQQPIDNLQEAVVVEAVYLQVQEEIVTTETYKVKVVMVEQVVKQDKHHKVLERHKQVAVEAAGDQQVGSQVLHILEGVQVKLLKILATHTH